MLRPPRVNEIRRWLTQKNPMGFFCSGGFTIRNIDPKPWSGHFNFLIRAGGKNLVLRFKGPEWGDFRRGILDEYKILKFVEKYRVAPRARYLDKNFFGEPMLLEEYVEGQIFNKFSLAAQERMALDVARFIAKINKIPVSKNSLPFREPHMGYRHHVKTWKERLEFIMKDPRTRWAGGKIEKLLPRAVKMLQDFEPRLKRVLKKNRPVFIFESAHAGHLISAKNGFRFLNWEQVSYGDPAYTLAVFLASMTGHPRFSQIRKVMVEAYLQENFISEFQELVEQRLWEREISNLIWTVWAYVRRNDRKPFPARKFQERIERAEKMLSYAEVCDRI